MDAIVPPNNTSLVTSDHAYYKPRVNHRCSTPEQVQLEGMEGRINTDVNGAEGRLVTNDNAAEARVLTAAQGLETRLNVDGRIDSFRSSTDRGFDKTQDEIEKFGLHNADITDKFGWRNLDESDKWGWRNLQDTRFYGHENFKASKDGFKEVALAACENTHQIIANADSHYAAIQLEAAKNHGMAQTKLIETKYQLELEAQKTAALLSAQVAECCCELKGAVTAAADETDELINKLNTDRIRDELAKTREELIALRVRASLLPPLTPAVTV